MPTADINTRPVSHIVFDLLSGQVQEYYVPSFYDGSTSYDGYMGGYPITEEEDKDGDTMWISVRRVHPDINFSNVEQLRCVMLGTPLNGALSVWTPALADATGLAVGACTPYYVVASTTSRTETIDGVHYAPL